MQKSSWHLTTENRVTSSSNAAIRSSHEFNCSTRSSLSAHHPTTSTHVSNHVREKARIRKQDNQNKSNSNKSRFPTYAKRTGNRVFPSFQFSPCVSRVYFFVHFLSHAKRIGSRFTGREPVRLIFEPIAEEEIDSSRD